VLENPELLSEKSKLEAELKGKKSLYERLKNIYDKTPQLSTIADVEKAEADYESAKAQLNGLQSQINFLQVKAPFAGVITNRFADKGAIIQSGLNNSNSMALFEVQDLQPIRLTMDIPETDAVLTDKNTKVEITFPELPNGKYSATVSRIAYGLNENTRTMKIEIDLPNKDLKIRSGMYAKVEIKRSGHKDVLSVPNEAIGNVKGQSFIYVVENNICKKVEIKTGIRDEKFTELLGGEIKETDNVVIQGKEFCSNGATVQIKTNK
jgi:RND family efflux transporter MFP subunit